jgi:predicted GH43/DUF377 family glycosyl hydrolase
LSALVTRSAVVITADQSRVLARLFVPGHELLFNAESRAAGVLTRILALPEETVSATLRRVLDRYAGRHRDLTGLLHAHYEQIAHRVPDADSLTEERRRLIGAWFTSEFAVEGAAVLNPSVVVHPDQAGLPSGACRFVLSLRAVGEGHLSCLEFRTGVVGPGHQLHIDPPGPYAEAGRSRPTSYDRDVFAAKLSEEGAGAESASYLVGLLPPRFGDDELAAALTTLGDQRVTQHGGERTAELARRIARCTYEVEFPATSAVGARVLWPHAPPESHGIEDARFVRFIDDDGSVHYRATYTAFDGKKVASALMETADFRCFRVSQLAGRAAGSKGMALFPRKVAGVHVALSRWDRENLALATSRDGSLWGNERTIYAPTRPWEIVQIGNCGSPVETDAGWLVLTHGVGPMREYVIGALLLDLDDPSQVIGALREPLISPNDDERDGYVPNVVYSCGALQHGDELVVPYGVSDSAVRFAFVEVPRLLDRLIDDGPPSTMRANSSA